MTLLLISSMLSHLIDTTYWYNIGNHSIIERVQKNTRQGANYNKEPLDIYQLQVSAACAAVMSSIPQNHARF